MNLSAQFYPTYVIILSFNCDLQVNVSYPTPVQKELILLLLDSEIPRVHRSNAFQEVLRDFFSMIRLVCCPFIGFLLTHKGMLRSSFRSALGNCIVLEHPRIILIYLRKPKIYSSESMKSISLEDSLESERRLLPSLSQLDLGRFLLFTLFVSGCSAALSPIICEMSFQRFSMLIWLRAMNFLSTSFCLSKYRSNCVSILVFFKGFLMYDTLALFVEIAHSWS